MRTFIGAAMAALSLVGCHAAAPAPAPAPAVVVVGAGESVDVSPPTRLDVTGLTADECDREGGAFVGDVCQGVDY